MRKYWLATLIVGITAIAVSYSVGFRVGYNVSELQFPKITPVQVNVNEGTGKPSDVDLTPLWEAYQTLKERYVDQSKLDLKKMLYGAVSGFVASVGDPYTIYVEPQEQQKFVEDLQGVFGGIGAEIGIRKNVLVVIAPLDGSPAEKAGLMPGDRILKIDETFTAELSLDEAVGKIRGEIGTEVKLIILPENAEETKEVVITRQTIVVPSLEYEVKDGVGIVRLLNFNADTARVFTRTVRDIRNLSSRKLIIDVRNNPGGYLDVAQDIASWFVPKGEAVVYEADAGGNRLAFPSRGYEGLEGFTVVVLMNKGSASASEILAGALRDSRGSKLVGEKSYGKGSVQELVNLSDGSVIKVTTAKWLTPNGISINDEGLKPDLEVPTPTATPELKEGEVSPDPQLEKALELLN